ncbi:clavesin-2 [Bacillus rossius redtenbacheri]|uniref:clavesin-2 n=1 Tax=Bacillus rossius redtenbacheri TaxID=93214 RepID=UPI002FDD269F
MATPDLILGSPWRQDEKVAPVSQEADRETEEYAWRMDAGVLAVAKAELREDADSRSHALQHLRQWISQNPDLRDCRTDSNFLLRFLRVKKFSLPMAQQMLLKYLNFRKTFGHLVRQLDVSAPSVNQLMRSGYIVASPLRDQHGRRVVIVTARLLDPYRHSRADMARAHMATYEACLDDEQTQVAGFTHVGDVAGAGAAHVTLWSPAEFATVLKWGEQSIPMRHKEIHILNIPTALRYVYDFAHNRFSDKMQKRFMIHNSLEDLHKKVDPKVLPKEYGGDMPLAQMAELWVKELESKRDRLLSLDYMQLLSDRGILCRKNQRYHYGSDMAGLAGSFRKLEVD